MPRATDNPMNRSTPVSVIACLGSALFVSTPARADTATAPAATSTAPGADTSDVTSRKQALIEAKQRARELAPDPDARARWQRELDRRIGRPPEPVVNLYNTWTHEYLAVPRTPEATGHGKGKGQRKGKGEPALVSADTINRFLRCHFTNQPTDMDARLLPTLLSAAAHFNATRIDIVSGFRSPKYNRVLRKKGREVSRKSQHPQGNAVDFRLPGVPVGRLHAWARSLRLGGVGLYPESGFIHVDTARVRYWTGR